MVTSVAHGRAKDLTNHATPPLLRQVPRTTLAPPAHVRRQGLARETPATENTGGAV